MKDLRQEHRRPRDAWLATSPGTVGCRDGVVLPMDRPREPPTGDWLADAVRAAPVFLAAHVLARRRRGAPDVPGPAQASTLPCVTPWWPRTTWSRRGWARAGPTRSTPPAGRCRPNGNRRSSVRSGCSAGSPAARVTPLRQLARHPGSAAPAHSFIEVSQHGCRGANVGLGGWLVVAPTLLACNAVSGASSVTWNDIIVEITVMPPAAGSALVGRWGATGPPDRPGTGAR
jgi:hypothetical protein